MTAISGAMAPEVSRQSDLDARGFGALVFAAEAFTTGILVNNGQ
jgi:hypothetical protein